MPLRPDGAELPREANRLSMAFRVANRGLYETAQQNAALAGMGVDGIDRAKGELCLEWLATELVRLANRGGGHDNIAVLLVHCLP